MIFTLTTDAFVTLRPPCLCPSKVLEGRGGKALATDHRELARCIRYVFLH